MFSRRVESYLEDRGIKYELESLGLSWYKSLQEFVDKLKYKEPVWKGILGLENLFEYNF
jgi:hypothetical protein